MFQRHTTTALATIQIIASSLDRALLNVTLVAEGFGVSHYKLHHRRSPLELSVGYISKTSAHDGPRFCRGCELGRLSDMSTFSKTTHDFRRRLGHFRLRHVIFLWQAIDEAIGEYLLQA